MFTLLRLSRTDLVLASGVRAGLYGVNTGNRGCLSGWKVGIGSVPSFKAEC